MVKPKIQGNSDFAKLFSKLTYRFTSWEVWKDFIVMLACAISNAVDKSHFEEREKLYLSTIQKYKPEEQAIFPELAADVVNALERNPKQDYLGKMFMELDLGNASGGQFFTPYNLCEAMAEITIGDVVANIEEQGYIKINDCACGAGATLIAGIHSAEECLSKAGLNWQNHILIVAQDVDYIAGLMCYIQLSLLGAAGYIKIGNSLTNPITENDTLENYWFTPIYQLDVWNMRKIIKGKMLL